MLNVTIICKCHSVAHFYQYKCWNDLLLDIKAKNDIIEQLFVSDATNDIINSNKIMEQVNPVKVDLSRFFNVHR